MSSKPSSEVGDRASTDRVRSVERALDLIAQVCEGPTGGLSVAELSRNLGIAKSSALATARTLVARGYLRVMEPGPRYQLGIGLIRLGDLSASQLPVAEICTPVLREIVEETALTARVAVSDGGYPLFVARVDGPGTVRFHTPLGLRESAHSTAAGKAILSALPTSKVCAMFKDGSFSAHTPQTITDLDILLEQLAIARKRGFAIDDEEDAKGVLCVGAAFFGHAGTCLGALSVTGIKIPALASSVATVGVAMRRYADKVTMLFDGMPYSETAILDASVSG